MFPPPRNRTLVIAAILLGSWVWCFAAGALQPGDGSGAPALWWAAGGPALAILKLVLFGIPIIALSLIASATGNPLSGLFALATGLWVVAAQGNTIEGWFHRTDASLPGDYFKLAIELVIWCAAMLLFLFVAMRWRKRAQAAFPFLVDPDRGGEDMTVGIPDRATWIAAFTTAIVSAILAFFLVRTADSGQVIGALMLAFMLGSLLGDIVCAFLFQKHATNVAWVVLAPLLVGLGAYFQTALGYGKDDAFREAIFGGRVSGLSLALPIHYASAAIAGCCLGAGWVRLLLPGEEESGHVEAKKA
ncbi:MAG: hypothetical protein WD768_04555 [Phycisphaeraceae bacterium]